MTVCRSAVHLSTAVATGAAVAKTEAACVRTVGLAHIAIQCLAARVTLVETTVSRAIQPYMVLCVKSSVMRQSIATTTADVLEITGVVYATRATLGSTVTHEYVVMDIA